MSSVQENLARVREEIAEHDLRSRKSRAHKDVMSQHDRILMEHEAAMREHERTLRDHRRSLEAHRHRKRSRNEKADYQHDKVSDTGMRFRFKHRSGSHTSKRPRASAFQDDGSSRTTPEVGHERSRSREEFPAATSASTQANLASYTAHPLARQPEPSPFLDPSLDVEKDQRRSAARQYDRDGRNEHFDPDAAFRTSLFDALADDEGAASYWEHVYGDPIHIYPRPNVESAEQPGELEAMNDEEYAEYVKRKMWERKNPHLVHEIRRREERERAKAEEAAERRDRHQRQRPADHGRGVRDNKSFGRDVDDALARGARRKEAKRWQEAWNAYLHKWRHVEDTPDNDIDILSAMPWPTRTGTFASVHKEGAEEFFQNMPLADGEVRATRLKNERFRWHPDKIQHRFGGSKVDSVMLQTVTSIFQTIDELLAAERRKSARD